MCTFYNNILHVITNDYAIYIVTFKCEIYIFLNDILKPSVKLNRFIKFSM